MFVRTCEYQFSVIYLQLVSNTHSEVQALEMMAGGDSDLIYFIIDIV